MVKLCRFKFQQIPSVEGKLADVHHLPVMLSKLRQKFTLKFYQYLTLEANFLLPNTISLSVPKGPPSTTIVASSNRAEVGDSIHVICTVLGEPDVDVNFRWQYPGQEVRGEMVCSS